MINGRISLWKGTKKPILMSNLLIKVCCVLQCKQLLDEILQINFIPLFSILNFFIIIMEYLWDSSLKADTSDDFCLFSLIGFITYVLGNNLHHQQQKKYPFDWILYRNINKARLLSIVCDLRRRNRIKLI